MIRPGLVLVSLLCLSLCLSDACAQGPASSHRDEVVMVDSDDPLMNRAIARARAGLDSFLRDALAPAPRNSMHAVKVEIADRQHTEYFWVTEVQRFGTGLRGRLDNEPQLVKHVRLGQRIVFRRSDIVDWLYLDQDGRMQGNFTLCVLLAKKPPEEARAQTARLGLRCD